MSEQAPMGMNRTGAQMSPMDSEAMKSAPAALNIAPPGDANALAEMRAEYIAEADPVGSVPLPGTMKGAVSTATSKLAGKAPEMLIDKLGERLAFERAGTRLYEALIGKFQALQDGSISMTLADLQHIREDEAKHFALVAEAIESIGGDPTAQTPCADLSGVESMGLMQVLTDPRSTIAQSLHAILTAEMADNAGWEMLIDLAQANGQQSMIDGFRGALDQERVHLQQVRGWLEEATLGSAVSGGTANAGGKTPSQLH